ncbi:MAG TPA: aminotransferase class V-fold PLP-dependent enzyme, partial [Candidatus Wallbacteria bacterium]|nr:aminotransferase class V-fold PLP-dependent enzyme [Candidatus Wallbacteria bacterium]
MSHFMKLHESFRYRNPMFSGASGDITRRLLEDARKNVASLINADPSEIFFTSSGTESNNLAVKGIMAAVSARSKGACHKIVTTPFEHPSVAFPVKTLVRAGHSAFYLKARGDGSVSASDAREILKDAKVLAVIHTSPENGRIMPVSELASAARENGAVVHSDACFIAGRVKIDVSELMVDTLSISGHKLCAPPGTGALYIRRGTRVMPQIEGGAEENGLRGGFYNIPAISAMGLAARIASEEMESRNEKTRRLKNILCEKLSSAVKNIKWIAGASTPLPFYVSFCLPGVNSEEAVAALEAAVRSELPDMVIAAGPIGRDLIRQLAAAAPFIDVIITNR